MVKFLKDLYTGVGELFIIYDRDQDLYERSIWLENSSEVEGLGFRGQAGTLGVSKRVPDSMLIKIDKVFNKLDKNL